MAKKKGNKFLWIEAFRPDSVKTILLPKKLKMYFNKLIKAGEIPNMLLVSSSPGTGKTTTAKALCMDLEANYLYINASEKTGIDTLRDTIKDFAVTKSFNGKPKIVILDEIDSNSNTNLQKALRGFMEEFHASCRFILTCNYINNVIEPLRSRLEIVDYNMSEAKIVEEMKPKIYKRIIQILTFKKIKYDEEVIKKIIELHYPDIRFMIKILDQFQKTYDEINKDIFTVESLDDEFYDFIMNKDLGKVRKYIVQRSLNYDELYTLLYKNLIPKLDGRNRGEAIVFINEGQKANNMVANAEINFMATVYDLINNCLD